MWASTSAPDQWSLRCASQQDVRTLLNLIILSRLPWSSSQHRSNLFGRRQWHSACWPWGASARGEQPHGRRAVTAAQRSSKPASGQAASNAGACGRAVAEGLRDTPANRQTWRLAGVARRAAAARAGKAVAGERGARQSTHQTAQRAGNSRRAASGGRCREVVLRAAVGGRSDRLLTSYGRTMRGLAKWRAPRSSIHALRQRTAQAGVGRAHGATPSDAHVTTRRARATPSVAPPTA